LRQLKVYIFYIYVFQSSYAGAYLEDKLSFYNKHMEKYGQFTGETAEQSLNNLKY